MTKGGVCTRGSRFRSEDCLSCGGLLILAFGIANEFSNGWQLDIVNLITIFGGIVVIVLGIFVTRRK